MPEITVYTRKFCTYCTAAKSLLSSGNYDFVEVNLDEDPELAAQVMAASGQRTVPQIFVDKTPVGGFRELHSAISSGEFAALLEQN